MAHVPAAVRRVQIIEAATAVIAREGVAGASTRAIAKQAGVPLATLHYVFSTKDEVLAAVLESMVERGKQEFDRLVERVLADGTDTLAGIFHRLVTALWETLLDNESEHRAQYELSLYAMRTPEAEYLGRALYDFALDSTSEILRIAGERSATTFARPVRDLAHFVVSSVDGVLLQALVHGDHEQARRGMDTIADAAVTLARTTAQSW